MTRVNKKESKESNAMSKYFEAVGFISEHRFHPPRRWRFDWAHINNMVGIEYEGFGKGHFGAVGYSNDCEKYNQAAVDGWKVLRFTAINWRDDKQRQWLKEFIATIKSE